MQQQEREWIFVTDEATPPERRGEPARLLERAARVADVKDRMIACLEELDRLELAYTAIHLSHAIGIIDDEAQTGSSNHDRSKARS